VTTAITLFTKSTFFSFFPPHSPCLFFQLCSILLMFISYTLFCMSYQFFFILFLHLVNIFKRLMNFLISYAYDCVRIHNPRRLLVLCRMFICRFNFICLCFTIEVCVLISIIIKSKMVMKNFKKIETINSIIG